MRLLDVCCGPGYGAGQAAELGLDAVGVDLSPAMIAEQLQFDDGSFDAVVCPFGVLHLPEPDKAFAEAFQVLRPGGGYGLTVWCTPDKAEFLGLAMKATSAHADMGVPLPPAPPLFQFADVGLASAALCRRSWFVVITTIELP
jgi:ubiquinone/menaquinone biosynthesis C-methylase UbiE